MRRGRAALVVVALLATGVSGVGASEARVRQASSVPTGVPPLPVVESVGPVPRLNEPVWMRGHDKGQSTLYDNGAGLRFSYWSFGDTVLDAAAGRRFLGNTGARTTDLTMADNVSSWTYDNLDAQGYPLEAFPRPPGCDPANCRVWGASTVADPANDRMLGIYHVVGNQDWYGLASWSESTGTWAAVAIANPSDPARPYMLWPSDSATTKLFNTGMIIEGGYLYAYGCWGSGTRRDCHLARVPTTDAAAAADRAAWRFYTSAGNASCAAGTWSADINCALPLASAAVDPSGQSLPMGGGAAGSSVFWNAYLGQYMTVYSRVVSNDVVYAVSSKLEGPWSAPAILVRGTVSPIITLSGGRRVNYAAYAHPEYAEQNGRVQYVTYVREMCADPAAPSCVEPPQGDPARLDLRSRFEVVKVTFGNPPSPSRYQRFASAETYHGDSANTLRINAAGPTLLDTSGTGDPLATAANDQHGAIFQPGAAAVGSSAVVRLDTQSSTNATSLAGLVMRNKVAEPHGIIFNVDKGRGYVAVVAAPGGGVSLRWDSDGDHDLDSRLPATPNAVGTPVWLRLTRTGATTYEGAYSTNSTTGSDGTWTILGTATGHTAWAEQDVGLFAAGPTLTATNRAVFGNFEIRPGDLGTWGTSMSLNSSGGGTPTCPATSTLGFQNQTVRNIVPASIGRIDGTDAKLRVRVSNAFGSAPLVVNKATIGLPVSSASGDLVASTVTPLTFGGQATVTIPAGAEQYSDVATMTLPAGETLQDRNLAISLFFQNCTGPPTWHRNGIISHDNYVYAGDQAANATPGAAVSTPEAWYFVAAADVVNTHGLGTVAAFGDSITDGVGAGVGTRWPDALFDRIVANGTVRSAVINQGQSGAKLADATGRLDRDVLSQPGIRTVIVALGVNDLISTSTPPNATQMIGYYRELARLARARGVRILVGTITPLGTSTTTARETVRQEVNAFLLQSNEFDGVIDFDAAVRRDGNPTLLRTEFQAFGAEGTVHPNAAGYKAMADAITLDQLVQPPRTR